MLYLAIPAQNEEATIGVLLWRLRTVLGEFPREYEVVVYDDASTDATADVAAQYSHAMPVTVLRGATPIGYASAVNALVRHISGLTRYPRRDALLLLQGDFTDPPGIVPEFARRFESGADLVVGQRTAVVDAPTSVKRLFSAAGLALRPFVRVSGVKDLTGSMRLMRISVLRDLLRSVGDAPVCEGDSWTANADLLLRILPFARRVETVPMEPTYGVRTRGTRRVALRDAMSTLKWGWLARHRRTASATSEEAAAESTARQARPTPSGRVPEEPELTAEHLRERSRERERLRGETDRAASLDGEPDRPRHGRGARSDSARDSRETRDGRRPAPARGESRSDTPAVRRDGRGDSRLPAEVGIDRARPREGTRETAKDGGRDAGGRPSRVAAGTAGGAGALRAVIDDVLFEDPFAGPPRPRNQSARDETPSPRQEGAPDASSTRAHEIEMHDSPADTSETQPPQASPYARTDTSVPDTDSADGDQTEDTHNAYKARDTDDERDAAPSADDDTVHSDESADARDRKRRRNRRSRRRKSKSQGIGADADDNASEAGESEDSPYRDGEGDDEVARERIDAADADGADDSDGSAPRRKRQRSRKPRNRGRASVADGAPDDADNRDAADPADQRSVSDGGHEGSGHDAESHAENDTDDDGRPARSRRRGRRGRRGGNRRSRNRDNDGSGSEDHGGDASSNSPSAE